MRYRQSSSKTQNGSLIIELAIALPLLLTLIAGIGFASFSVVKSGAMIEAARAGARNGSMPSVTTDRCERAIESARNSLIGAAQDPDQFDIVATDSHQLVTTSIPEHFIHVDITPRSPVTFILGWATTPQGAHSIFPVKDNFTCVSP